MRHFVRTATEDYQLRDKTIKEGESVILWYQSAKRDEEIFDAPFVFRVDRKDAKQPAFGFGAHVCLGQHLARMDQPLFVGGLKSLPIRNTMA